MVRTKTADAPIELIRNLIYVPPVEVVHDTNSSGRSRFAQIAATNHDNGNKHSAALIPKSALIGFAFS